MSLVNQRGQLLVLAVIVMTAISVTSLVVYGGARTFYSVSSSAVANSRAIQVAEAGVDKAIASLNVNSNYSGESNLNVGTGQVDIQVAYINPNRRKITTISYVPDNINPQASKKITVYAVRGSGISFPYALQADEGGMTISGDLRINCLVGNCGSLFSNGNVSISGLVNIHGSVQVSQDRTLSISGNGSIFQGIQANNIDFSGNVTTNGPAYYSTVSGGLRANGQNCTNSSTGPNCFASSPPLQKVGLPISDATLDSIKSQAQSATPVHNNQNYTSCVSPLRGRYNNSSMNVSYGCTLTVETPVYFQGNIRASSNITFIIKNNGPFYIDGSLYTSGNVSFVLDSTVTNRYVVLVADSTISMSGNVSQITSSSPPKYVLLVSRHSNPSTYGLSISGNLGNVMLYAPHTTILMAGTNASPYIGGYSVDTSGDLHITYDPDLINVDLGVGGTNFTIERGTYQLQ